ncbi:PAS domain-containing sensor histidine kinase [Caballeronia sp. SL2Y3]|uniref:PAS domain-containing sensor histidine kinase n=1 Tax=Caballeronia sp. SL2Y3 TaxID=2878151 RepID=UPI001FD36FA7|nr:PAS domain-containing sensor histidine kinase [Caballeronia sp. SL2Y3]
MTNNDGPDSVTASAASAGRVVAPRAGLATAVLAGAILFAAWWALVRSTVNASALTPRVAVLLIASGLASAVLLACLVYVVFLMRRRTHGVAPALATLPQARLDGIIRATTEAIITVDSQQRIVLFNPMAERVFRCPASEAIGASLSRFIPERYRTAHEEQVRRFGQTGVSDRQMGAQRVLYGLRADGEEFPVEASISQIDDIDGKLFTVILRDVTQRVEAEAELQRSREELRALSANLQHEREKERTRIARELHDDVGQTLSALKMDVAALEARLNASAAPRDDVAGQLARMRRAIDGNIASLRRIAAHQRPVMLDDLGLAAAIDWLVDDFTQRQGIDVECEFGTGEIAFNTNAATAVFRIIEEALDNVALHARASRVKLSLGADDAHCVLRVEDDGVGAPALPGANGKSFGLLGVRERANALGGTVLIESNPDDGFALTVRLPLAAVSEQESQP